MVDDAWKRTLCSHYTGRCGTCCTVFFQLLVSERPFALQKEDVTGHRDLHASLCTPAPPARLPYYPAVPNCAPRNALEAP